MEYLEHGKKEQAFQYFQKALLKDSSRVEANYWLAFIYSLDCPKNDGACLFSINYLNKVISINKTYRKAFKQRGLLRMKINDYNGSLSDLNQAIILYPNDTALYFNRAIVKQILKDKNGACEDFNKAIKLGSIIARNRYVNLCGSISK